ncbi:S8 family peptidase [Cecembia calidifontis]|nr:S8 family serine peptidase [Cecembia calidifontis]
MKKFVYFILISFFLHACANEHEFGVSNEEDEEMLKFPVMKAEPIPDHYIIVFNEDRISFRMDADDLEGTERLMVKEVEDFLKTHRVDPESVQHIYSIALPGFSAKVNAERLPDLLVDPKVKYIEQDRRGELGPFQVLKRPGQEEEQIVTTQVIPWGVARAGGPFTYRGRHSVFVLDTGIDLAHPDLNVDDKKGFDAYNSKKKDYDLNDEHGHGTHVAGTIGALDNHFGVVGVAAGVPVVPVKIFTGPRAEYTYSGLIAGINHVGVRGIPGDVANLSFGGFDDSRALDEAVLRVSEKRRIWMVIAAGNSGLPATSFSPARVNGPFTITVSAFQIGDRFASFSHFGFPVKFSAPGVNVRSTWTNNRYVNSSGTSMAAPHVSGIRVLGEIEKDGYVLNHPIPENPDPIAVRR